MENKAACLLRAEELFLCCRLIGAQQHSRYLNLCCCGGTKCNSMDLSAEQNWKEKGTASSFRWVSISRQFIVQWLAQQMLPPLTC